MIGFHVHGVRFSHEPEPEQADFQRFHQYHVVLHAWIGDPLDSAYLDVMLKKNMVLDARNFTTPLVDFIKSQVGSPKYKLIKEDKSPRLAHKKDRDNPDGQST